MKWLQGLPEKEPLEQKLIEIPGPRWTCVGYWYAGGRVGLDRNVYDILNWRYSRWRGNDPNVVLRSLMRASVGITTAEIAGREGLSMATIGNIMAGVRNGLGVERRWMRSALLPAAVGNRILRIVSYGEPAQHFRTTPYERVWLGLLGRGVERSLLAQAVGIEEGTVKSRLSRMLAEEGGNNLTSGIAAGILTHRLGATSLIPYVRADDEPSGVRELMPEEQWDRLAEAPTLYRLRRLFAALETHERRL